MEEKWKHPGDAKEVVGRQDLAVGLDLGLRENKKTPGFVMHLPRQIVMSFKDRGTGGRPGLGRKPLS